MAARVLTVALGAVAVLVLAIPHHAVPSLVWNPTASAPRGLYAVEPIHDLARGELVLASPPVWVAQLAAARGYLPLGTPLVKRIVALSGEHICASGGDIRVNDLPVAQRLAWDSQHRPLPQWTGCRTLGFGQELLLNPAPASFDGRYFGPVSTSNNLGRLEALWTF